MPKKISVSPKQAETESLFSKNAKSKFIDAAGSFWGDVKIKLHIVTKWMLDRSEAYETSMYTYGKKQLLDRKMTKMEVVNIYSNKIDTSKPDVSNQIKTEDLDDNIK